MKDAPEVVKRKMVRIKKKYLARIDDILNAFKYNWLKTGDCDKAMVYDFLPSNNKLVSYLSEVDKEEILIDFIIFKQPRDFLLYLQKYNSVHLEELFSALPIIPEKCPNCGTDIAKEGDLGYFCNNSDCRFYNLDTFNSVEEWNSFVLKLRGK